MSEVMNQNGQVNMDQECSCLFCGRSFKVSEFVFAKNEPNAFSSALVDTVFENAVKEYKSVEGDYPVDTPYRRFFTWGKDDIESTESGPNGSRIPLTVRGHMTEDRKQGSKRRGFLAMIDEEEQPEKAEEQNEMILISTVRLCPYCHMTLPAGFSTEKVRRVGLIGGSRCGKTTYMLVACKYMENYLGLLGGGLDLGEVSFLQECQKYLDRMYDSQRGAAGAVATPQDDSIKEKPVFPIIAHITPSSREYQPFYLIFQDIPGEYMLPENQDKLINSAIPQSTDLISLVDINSLTWTRMQDNDGKYGAVCELEASGLFRNFSMLGNALKKHNMLETIQLCLTKLDYWLDADPEVGQGTVFSRDGNSEHRGSISDKRLDDISRQVNYRLKNTGGKDQSGLMEAMLRSLGLDQGEIHTAYTAVASRSVPNNEAVFEKNGIDYSTSLNVMEPLLNIFSWGNLLPHDNNDRQFGNTEEEEEPTENKRRGLLRIFGRGKK